MQLAIANLGKYERSNYKAKKTIRSIQIITGGGFIVWWLYDGYKIFTGTIMDKNGVEVD